MNNGDVGFLTCAHVLCDLSGQCDLSASFDVVQPSHGVTGTNEVCGIHQNSICTSSGSNGCTIDAAVVKLTKDRVPERGLFAELTVDTLEENGLLCFFFRLDKHYEKVKTTDSDHSPTSGVFRSPCLLYSKYLYFLRFMKLITFGNIHLLA